MYIALYNNKFNENYNNINTYSRRIRLSQINIANSKDRLNEHEQTGNLYVTRVNVDENDNDWSENIIVRNIKVNENHYEKIN